jgi:hypothetical protein
VGVLGSWALWITTRRVVQASFDVPLAACHWF